MTDEQEAIILSWLAASVAGLSIIAVLVFVWITRPPELRTTDAERQKKPSVQIVP